MCYYMEAVARRKQNPGLAKFGIALEWGSRGRWFESSNSDQNPQVERLEDFSILKQNSIIFYLSNIYHKHEKSGINSKIVLDFYLCMW